MSNPMFDRINKGIDQGTIESAGEYDSASTSEQLQDLYNGPTASASRMGRVTEGDVMHRAALLFGLMLAFAAVTYFLLPQEMQVAAWATGAIVGLILGWVIALKKTINVGLIVAYAVFEGIFVGAVSTVFESWRDGIVGVAVAATLSVCAVVFAGWKFGLVRVTSRSRRFFMFATLGYGAFLLVNFVVALLGGHDGWGITGFGSPFSILISVVGVCLASYSFAVDMDSIERSVKAQLPEKYSWLLAHSLLVTVVWLYVEMLRLIAQTTGRR